MRMTISTRCESATSPPDVAARVTLRQLAINDADAAFDYLVDEAPPGTATKFIDVLQQALDHISQHPLTGSLRFGFDLDIPELRSWPLSRFPYLVFYVCNEDHVDVWRILHAHRDIPTAIGDG